MNIPAGPGEDPKINLMANPAQEVFHCPSCGALVPLRAGEETERVCSACGFEFRQPVRIAPRSVGQPAVSTGGFVQRDVSARRRTSERVEPVVSLDLLPETSAAGEAGDSGGSGKEEIISDDGRKKVVRRMKKRRRTRIAPLLFLCGWTIIVMLVVILVRNNNQDEEATAGELAVAEEQKLRAKERAVAAFLDLHETSCRKTLDEFLAANSSTARTQFVRDPNRLAPVMSDYYKSTIPWSIPSGARLATRARNVLMRGDRRAIELVLGVIEPGKTHPDLEAAFVFQAGRWVLEWESFVRYSSDAWQLFVKGVGDQEGVFRVFLRQSAVAPESEQPVIKVQFLPPRDDELMWQQDSDWVEIRLNSENGRRVEAMIRNARKEPELGDSLFGRTDPKGLYRARVVLAWGESQDGGKDLELREVQAGNWYGPGFEEEFEGAPAPVATERDEEPAPKLKEPAGGTDEDSNGEAR